MQIVASAEHARLAWPLCDVLSTAATSGEASSVENRFSSWMIRDDEHLEATTLYVLENPVRAGL